MRLILTLLLLIITYSLNAQNLPAIQKESVKAPAAVKIDGKLNEWDNKFQAYNKANQIYYTLSNDANNLYLTVQAVDFSAIKKILKGGVTFTINKLDKKKDSTVAAFTFPYYEPGQKLFSFSNEWVSAKPAQVDSLAKLYNRQLPTAFKLIGITGLKSINGGSIPIYNEDNINAVALFDREMRYNYELAVPLKLIGLAGVEKLNYNLQLNGQKTYNGYDIKPVPGRGNILVYEDDKKQMNIVVGPGGSPEADLYFATDFWGEYTLAR